MELFDILFNQDFWFAVLRSTTPVLLTTLGAIIASRAGARNIALEGTMLTAALVGVVGSALTQNAYLGLLMAVVSGIIMSNILAYFALKLKSNIILTGIALNLMATGGTVFGLFSSITKYKYTYNRKYTCNWKDIIRSSYTNLCRVDISRFNMDNV